jgi:hypothetical protein
VEATYSAAEYYKSLMFERWKVSFQSQQTKSPNPKNPNPLIQSKTTQTFSFNIQIIYEMFCHKLFQKLKLIKNNKINYLINTL